MILRLLLAVVEPVVCPPQFTQEVVAQIVMCGDHRDCEVIAESGTHYVLLDPEVGEVFCTNETVEHKG